MICTQCEKDRPDTSFSMKHQKESGVCNMCNKGQPQVKTYGLHMDIYDVRCMRCGRRFSWTAKKAICGVCRTSEDYKNG